MADDEIEKEIAEALKPLEAARRPFVSMVGNAPTLAADPPHEPPRGQEEASQTGPTVTQRLQQLMEENGRLQGRIDALQEDIRDMESRLASLILRVLAVLE